MHPFPEPAVVREGPAATERISGQFYHISIRVVFHGIWPRAQPVRRSTAVVCPQISAFVNGAGVFARWDRLLGGSAEQTGNCARAIEDLNSFRI